MGRAEHWLIQMAFSDNEGMLLNPGVNGGLFQKQPRQEVIKQVNYITIESIHEYLIKIEKLGVKMLVLKQQVPTVGWIAGCGSKRQPVQTVAVGAYVKRSVDQLITPVIFATFSHFSRSSLSL